MHSPKQRFDGTNFTPTVRGQAVAARLHFEVSRRILLLIVACLYFGPSASAQTSVASAQINGTVFVSDSQGPSYVPGVKVTLLGSAISIEQDTDQEGRFSFSGLAAGAYTITAQFPGLEANQSITVEAGKPANIALELKPSAVKTEVMVTAEPPEVKGETPTQTISSTMVRDTPNQNERAENVLALIPGVVRGLDGRINIKGARNTQSGALVNGANVTDPATGSAAFDVPIDVVASVQVISNPYDPQYGKLTGAVSTMDTKTTRTSISRFRT
jgi:Carboxypeptidase regulatory-like domain/TonB-dependent Receptor Plug Domain